MSKLQGISPKLPLTYSKTDGPYLLNKNLKETVKQNFKMLVLTSPGERVMVPDFGVGINSFLFEAMDDSTYSQVVQKIQEQVGMFIPSITLEAIDFVTSDEDPTLPLNELRVSIKYNILPFNQKDELLITSTMTS